MTLSIAIYLTGKLVFFCYLTQSLEIFYLSRQSSFQKIWSYANLAPDLEAGLPISSTFAKILFSNRALTKISETQIILSTLGLMFPHWIFLSLLIILQIIVGIRFRGSFNGGSDMMTFVVATGTLVALSSTTEKGQSLGLLYIAVHTLYSYFKSGMSKLSSTDWLHGQALPGFLKRSLFINIQKISERLGARLFLSEILCWGVIFFELFSVSLVFYQGPIYLYFTAAVIFHFVIFLIFGLNRFLWIWLSAWPATLYSLSLLNSH